MGCRLHCAIIGFPCHFCNWANWVSSTGFLEINNLFSEVKNGTAIVLNIPMHAGTVLPRGWWEPAEQDTTCHGLLVQRQAETNNAAPYLEGIIPSEVWGYLCWVWVYVMSVAIPMCQLVSYSETHTCMFGNEDVILTEVIAQWCWYRAWVTWIFKFNARFNKVFIVIQVLISGWKCSKNFLFKRHLYCKLKSRIIEIKYNNSYRLPV